ncbi:hypothetical protein [Devosia ginsengisoli]|uniref:hypothetical protein n=1 Tax=Devosia ginsengisoli TaxID=400770 RepID=UPI0026EA5DCD|nr:hypothetical protein [Devosia ginsengisoli]MCR6672197.1 hypothetical protein [Devosia ginsengisoli]
MLSRIALRVVVQEALRGATLAGANVLDSQFTALDLDADGALRTDQDRPFVSVYTDDGRGGAGNGFMSLFGDGTVQLVIEAGISAAMLERDSETGATVIVGLGLPDTDANMELTLDLMMRQVADRLTDPGNAWADLARELLGEVTSIERSRIGQKQNGTRVAAQELRITGGLLADPVKGADLAGSTYAKFLAALAASSDSRLQKLKIAFETALAGTAVDWELVQRELGLTDGQSIALGGRPLATADGDDPASFESVTIEVDPS